MIIIIICLIILYLIIKFIQYNININTTKNQIISSLKLNRNYLPDPKLTNQIKNIIKKYIKNKIEYEIDFTNIQIETTVNDDEIIFVRFYYIDPKLMSWNTTQNLIEIKGKLNKNDGTFDLININENINSIDIGAIIPQMSDTYLTNFSRNRKWIIQRKKWPKYKKEWNVKWSDKPILRGKNPDLLETKHLIKKCNQKP